MNTPTQTKSPSIRGHKPGLERSVEVPEDHSLELLCFTTVSGLLSFVAAMFTTMLPLSAGWRYFWLVICLVTFALSLIGLVRFCLSYQHTGDGSGADESKPAVPYRSGSNP